MKKFTKVALSALSLASVAAISIAGTVAYLTSTDADINVMTIGNVKIEQHEQDRDGADFEQGQTMMPIVTGANIKDEAGYPKCENYIDKIVTVENIGKEDAYVRTLIAIPNYTYDGLDENNASTNVLHWNGYSLGDKQNPATSIPGTDKDVDNMWSWGKAPADPNEEYTADMAWPGNGGGWNLVEDVTIGDQEYTVYIITHLTALAPGEITAPNMIGLYLDSNVDFDGTDYTINGQKINGFDGSVEILVASQAVQADGFSDAWTALDAAFGSKAVADCFNAPTVAAPESGATRPAGFDPSADGGVNEIDNLVVYDKSDESTNLRALYTRNGKIAGDLTVTNSYLDGTYAMNVIGDDTGVLTVENTALRGWVSYDGFTSASFTNCTFDVNSNAEFYKTIRPYSDIVLTDCDFAAGYEFWLDMMPEGTTITFKNCTIGGVAITDASQLNVVYEGGAIVIG